MAQAQALVSQLRRHSAVATAVLSDFQNRMVQTRGGTATIADWGFVFRVPGGQTALTEDTGFDGTYSAAPPANNNATRQVARPTSTRSSPRRWWPTRPTSG